MKEKIWEALCQKQLTLDQTTTPLEMNRVEIEQFYDPLAKRLMGLVQSERRLVMAVAGPPGSGKTCFSMLLAAVINARLGEDAAVMIQQDGWHFPNAYLDSHHLRRDGQNILLRKLKGSPETYDTRSAFAFLQGVKEGAALDYPVYSRTRHDPLEHAGTVSEAQRILIVEGNYWLFQEEPWTQFLALFDVSIFLSARAETLVEGLRMRHIRGGKTPEFTDQHMARVDIPNIYRVLEQSAPAQIVVHKIDGRKISHIEYRDQTLNGAIGKNTAQPL
jgi:pantothenate kinase